MPARLSGFDRVGRDDAGGPDGRSKGRDPGAGFRAAGDCVALYDLYRSGDIDKARLLQNVLLKASKVIQSEHAIAGIKFVMDQRGYHGGIPRSPLVPLTDAYKQRILELLNSIEPALVRA